MKINETRKWILIIYALAVSFICVFAVPWLDRTSYYSSEYKRLSYRPIWSSPSGTYWETEAVANMYKKLGLPPSGYINSKIAFDRLIIELIAITIIGATAFCLDDTVRKIYDFIRSRFR